MVVSLIAVAGLAVVSIYLLATKGERQRKELCGAVSRVYDIQQRRFASDDVKLQTGAFDKSVPTLTTPQAKLTLHQSNLRNYKRFSHSELPGFCPQHAQPDVFVPGFSTNPKQRLNRATLPKHLTPLP